MTAVSPEAIQHMLIASIAWQSMQKPAPLDDAQAVCDICNLIAEAHRSTGASSVPQEQLEALYSQLHYAVKAMLEQRDMHSAKIQGPAH